MDLSAKITSKGQVTIPKAVRDALGLHEGDALLFRIESSRAVVAKTPLALELRRGAVTGPMGIAALASVVLRRPLLLLLAEQRANGNPEAAARLADPARRHYITVLTAIVGLFLFLDGLSQTALALIVPTRSFVPDSTGVRIFVIGVGVIVTTWYICNHNHPNRPHQRSFPAQRKS